MKELRNPLLLIPGLAALLLVAVVVLAERVFIANFERLERTDVETKSTQILSALDAELGQLAAYTLDHAQWDEPFRLVVEGERNFFDISMQTSVLQTIGTDLALVVAANGRDLYSVLLLGEGEEATRVAPAPESMLAPMRQWHGRLEELARLPPHRRLFQVDGHIHAFAGARISNSFRSVNTDASLFFARRLDAHELASVRRNVVLPLEMLRLDDMDSRAMDPALADWLAAPDSDLAMLPTARPDRMAGVALLRDLAGKPIAVLRTEVGRELLASGRRNTWLLVGAIATLLTLFVAGAMLLILELRRSNKAQQEEHERYRRVLENIEECVALVDAQSGRIVECNLALQRKLGLREQGLQGMPIEGVFGDFQRRLEEWQKSGGRGPTSFESRLRTRDGSLINTDVTFARLHHSGRELICVVARDVTLRKQAEQEREEHRRKLEHLAGHDPLTGLPNRLYLKTQLPAMLQQAAIDGTQVGLLFLDLDHFKSINDTRGHAAGDELLRVAARRLVSGVASNDTVVRMGGDEFVILVRDLPDRQAAANAAQRVVESLREPLQIDGQPFGLSGSIGIGLFPRDGADAESLLQHADIALYEAKNAGRDNFRFFEPGMSADRSERVVMQQALRQAIGTDELYLEYQPIFNLKDGRLASFEALVRWNPPHAGAVPPERFIAVAEQSGLIHVLGEQVLDMLCRQLAAWRAKGVRLRPVTFNVSPLQLERDSLTQMIRSTAARHGIELPLLQLEVTETALMKEGGRHVASLQSLRESGCRILIDDFGIGYSNLAQLKNLPLDRIKIDRSFVRDMAVDANDAAIVTAVCGMAHDLGLEVVAEGIEETEQHLMLQKLGCDYGQGFHLSRPLTAEACVALLQAAAHAEHVRDTDNKVLQLQRV